MVYCSSDTMFSSSDTTCNLHGWNMRSYGNVLFFVFVLQSPTYTTKMHGLGGAKLSTQGSIIDQ